MTNGSATSAPFVGYLALAPSVSLFALDHSGAISLPPALLSLVLLVCGTLQLLCGLQSRQKGQLGSAAIFLPLGLFWFSMVGCYMFPAMGIGHAPRAMSMLVYLTMWGGFAALLYLGSFQQHRTLQLVFSTLMICLLLLAVSEIRDNSVFDSAAATAGCLSGLAALYTGLAHLVNRGLGRSLLPVVELTSTDVEKVAES